MTLQKDIVSQGAADQGHATMLVTCKTMVKTVIEGQQAFDAAGTSIAWRYVSGEIEYPLHIVKEMSESGSGLPVKTMPMVEWVEGAERLGMNKMLAAYLRGATETNIALAFPKLVKDGGKVA